MWLEYMPLLPINRLNIRMAYIYPIAGFCPRRATNRSGGHVEKESLELERCIRPLFSYLLSDDNPIPIPLVDGTKNGVSVTFFIAVYF